MMQATVFQGVGLPPKKMVVPRPGLIERTDAIVRVVRTTIVSRQRLKGQGGQEREIESFRHSTHPVSQCGTDLHILGGNVPQTTPGRILGHEGIGIVVEAGDGVRKFKVGDRVLVK